MPFRIAIARTARITAAGAAVLLLAVAAAAQSLDPPSGAASPAPSLELPPSAAPAPVAPEVYSEDARGRVTLRATRLAAPLTVDGDLDEAVYRETKAITHFVQMEPREGQPATERTAAWLFFDDRNFYVSVRAYDSAPEKRVANELRRDSSNIFQNDNLTVSIDPLFTRRSGYFFQTNALGALRDQEVFDERNNNNDWNTVWFTRSKILPDGWSMEMAIPFRSLRFKNSGPQIWGFNLRRIVRWKNEAASISPIPAAAGFRAMYRFDIFATLVGVETPGRSANLEVKPYAIGSMTTNRAATPPFTNDPAVNAGGDVKYALTRSLVADFTYRTDFAQVEEDQQQVNLTRFSLFFPEKRDFFLEGQGLFSFGGDQRLAPVVFYSRRIGLNNGVAVPIIGGGRVSGRAGKYSLGMLNMQTESAARATASASPTTNFSVLRLRRDVLRRSNVGVIGTFRAPSGGQTSGVVGLDANMAFFQNVIAQAFWTASRTGHDTASLGDRTSYGSEFEYSGDRYGVRYEHLMVGRNFDPQVGFLQRRAFRRNYGQLRFSPRTRTSRVVRKHSFATEFDHITDNSGVLETREIKGTYRLELHNNDQWTIDASRNFELLRQSFPIVPGLVIPAGEYRFGDFRTAYQFGPQRRLSGTVTLGSGSFYNGRNTEVGYRGLVEVSPRFSIEPGVTLNRLDLSTGTATTTLFTSRINLMLSPLMAVSGLAQYNSTASTLSASLRYRWEYQPGSNLFVVYSDGRDTLNRVGFPDLVNRTFVVKVTRLWRF